MTSLACDAALEPENPPVRATISAAIASATAAPVANATRKLRWRRSEATMAAIMASPAPARSSNAEEAAQCDAAAERGDEDGCRDQHLDQRDEADGREVVDELEILRQRIDDRRLAEPQHADGHRRPGEPDDQAFDHERPADEPVGGPDQPHHLHLAATCVDREPDRVRDQ